MFRSLSDEAHKNKNKRLDEDTTIAGFNRILKKGLEYAMQVNQNPQIVRKRCFTLR